MYRHLMMILCSFSALFADLNSPVDFLETSVSYTSFEKEGLGESEVFVEERDSRELLRYTNEDYEQFLEMFEEIGKEVFLGPDNTVFLFYYIEDELRYISSYNAELEKSSGFHTVSEYMDADYFSSHYDDIEAICTHDKRRRMIQKNVASIFHTEFSFDALNRLKSVKFIDNEVFFFKKKEDLTKVICVRGEVVQKTSFFITKRVCGEAGSYILKDKEGIPVAVVVNSDVYKVVLDLDHSIRQVIDPRTDEVVADLIFSKEGHLLKQKGPLINVPFCFRGMYQEKFCELYFDVDTYYDPDLGMFLEND